MKTQLNLEMTPYDELFQTTESTAEAKKEKVTVIDISELHNFTEHPFQVRNDSEMDDMVESIKRGGVTNPIIVRPRKDSGYEIIAGHRRKRACELAGITTIPALIRNYDDNEAVIQMIDTNLQRETILPSEKAKAYKMKLDAIKSQGKRTDLTSGQVVQKLSVEIVGEESGESYKQVQRYIRLNELHPSLLKMVDDKKIAFNPAVEISYLSKVEQLQLYDTILKEQSTPSLSQAKMMKELSGEGKLTNDNINSIISEEKGNQKGHCLFKKDTFVKYFPKSYTDKQIEETIVKLLSEWQHKEQNRRAQER